MKPLFLILKGQYFNEILSGSKTEEYRLVTPFWVQKLVGREYSEIIFQLGYSKESPRIKVEYLGYELKNLKHDFFGSEVVPVFALKLGKIEKIR